MHCVDKMDPMILTIEASFALWHGIRKSTSGTDIAVAAASFYSSVTGKSAIVSMIRLVDSLVENLKEDFPNLYQSGKVSDWIDVCDLMYSNVSRLKTSPLANKLLRVFNHIVAHSFYSKMGIEVDPKVLSKFEEKRMRPNMWNFVSFADAVVDMILFLAKAGRQAIISGNIDCFFIDEVVVTQWMDNAAKLRKDAEFLSNPKILGYAVPLYLEKVKQAIAEGEKLAKVFAKKAMTHSTIYGITLELISVEKRYRASMLASKFRRAPIAVFLYGDAGVAKSFLAEGLFLHYCSVRGVSGEEATCYTLTENDDYMSGYKSHYCGFLIDDAAKHRPNKIQGVDPSVAYVINAVNNVGWSTNQAELADKGKIPFLSEWVGVTSNIDDLNCNLYYNSSAAFLRRLPYRIVPIVKREFCKIDEEGKPTTQIDPKLIPANEQYPDCWTFKVDKAKVDGLNARYENYKTFDCYADLLVFMTGVYQTHIDNQDKLMETVSKMVPQELCACKLPVSLCRCAAKVLDDEVLENLNPFVEAQSLDEKVGKSVRALSTLKQKISQRLCKTEKLRQKGTQADEQKLFEQLWAVKRAEILDNVSGEDHWIKTFVHQQMSTPYFSDPILPETSMPEMEVKVLVEDHEDELKIYEELRPQERMRVLNGIDYKRTDMDREWLKTVPQKVRDTFFIGNQLQHIMEQVRMWSKPFKLTPAQEMLMETFVYHEAPALVGDGWSLTDILCAAQDYLDAHIEETEHALRQRTKEILREDAERRTWLNAIGWWAAKTYCRHSSVRWVADQSARIWFVKKAFAWCFGQAPATAAEMYVDAREYNRSLKGDHKWLKIIIGAATAAGFLIVIYKLMDNYLPKACKDKQATATKALALGLMHEDDIKRMKMGDVEHTSLMIEEGRLPPTEDKVCCAVEQAKIDETGKLPKVRGDEKANVWKTIPRNITKLDVHERRPGSESELVTGVRHNLCFAKLGDLETRVLVVDNETIAINSHAVKDNDNIEIWLGPKVDGALSPSVALRIEPDMLNRLPGRDITLIKSWALPRRFKDIRHYLPKRSFQSVGPCKILRKLQDGELESLQCHGMQHTYFSNVEGLPGMHCRVVLSKPETPTVAGDCGSLLVADTPIGTVIAGLHCALTDRSQMAVATPLYYEDIETKPMVTLGPTDLKGVKLITQAKRCEKATHQVKLYTDYHSEGKLMVHGGLDGFRARPKFTGTKTLHADYVLSRGAEFDPKIEDNMARPNPGSWEGAQQVLKNYLEPTHSMSETAIRACVTAMCEHYDANLCKEDWEDIHPVPFDVAVNGFPGVPNVDSVQMTTSGGFGWRGPKIKHFGEQKTNLPWQHYRNADEHLRKYVQDMRDKAATGVRPGTIFSCSEKNEMLSKKKVEAKRVRLIYMCELGLLLNLRMSTLGLTRVMVRLKHVFGIAVGLNTHSEEWHDLFAQSEKLLGDNWIAGDFKAFESVLSLLISNAVSKILLWLCQRSGNFDEEELFIFETLLSEISNATVDFLGTLITLLGGEVSGHQLTTFFNCLANVLLHMYAYVLLKLRHDGSDLTFETALDAARSFFMYVFIVTLGDDVFQKVSEKAPWYTHTAIQEVFASIGITYTMADKEAESVPYIPLSEVTFLKRSFVRHSEFPIFVAALDKRSIYKMLLYTIPSKEVTYEEQMASALCSAQAEAFFHGKEFFDQISNLIEDIPKHKELEFRMKELPRPSWQTMVTRFLRASPNLLKEPAYSGVLTDVETSTPVRSDWTGVVLVPQAKVRVDAWGSTTMGRSPEDRIYGAMRLSRNPVPKALKLEETQLHENPFPSKNFHKSQDLTCAFVHEEMTLDSVLPVITKIHNIERKKKKRMKWRCTFQSYVADTVSPPTIDDSTNVVHHEQVGFANEEAVESVSFGPESGSLARKMAMPQDLSEYMSRPLKIFSYTWPENAADGFKAEMFPFTAFFNDANIKNKLKGFSLLRCTMKLKFMINGSPFYYGAMLVPYTPLALARTDTADKNSGPPIDICANSQKPHVWLTPQDMSSVEMTVPFVYPYPFVDTSFAANLDKLGKVQLWQVAPLLSANGTSSSNVDVTVYAWAENIVLSGASDRAIMQSGYAKSKQIVEKASQDVASSVLEEVPILGKAAKATTSVARALGDIASVFGFTNTPNVSDVNPVKQSVFSLASSEISEPITKLSLSAKQEIAVGGTEFGADAKDSLHLDNIITRPALLTTVDWSTTDVPETTKFTSFVSPAMSVTVGSVCQHLPVSYFGTMFQYWRGDFRFTFKVIKSPYHRGRLAVTWDRAAASLNAGANIGNPNSYSTIMDLDESSEVSMVVPYQQAQQFMFNNASVFNTATYWSTSATPPSTTFTNGNGVIRLAVMNRLTAPEPSSSVRILVFVNAEPGFHFAAPRDLYGITWNDATTGSSWNTYHASSATLQSKDCGAEPSLGKVVDNNEVYDQVFGEKIVSLRPFLHRSSLSFQRSAQVAGANTGVMLSTIPIKHIPPIPGVAQNGWYTKKVNAVSTAFNFCRQHPISWVVACFAGYKGSVNVSVNVDHSALGGLASSLAISRVADGRSLTASDKRRPSVYLQWNSASTDEDAASYGASNTLATVTGVALTNTVTNAGLSANLPYYSNAGFLISNPGESYAQLDNLGAGNDDWWAIECRTSKTTSVTGPVILNVYYGTGPDFDTVFFINCPPVYFRPYTT